jgi:3-hydroxybutyryl-CoA dehydrogenase
MDDQTIAVIGAGTMGRGIAQVAAQAGFQVVLYDSVPGAAENGLEIIKRSLQKLVEKRELEKGLAESAGKKISAANDLDGVADSFFIVEAITEEREAKKALFQKLDQLCDASAVLASNTSSIPITELASVTHHPENVIGMHFMNPVPLMPGVEIIKGLKTSEKTYQKTRQLAEQFSKQPVYSSDKAGFVINRILMPLINEAIHVVEEGTSTVEDVDNGAKYCLNHPLGPLALSDVIGNDTTHHILSVIEDELGERFKPASLLTWMVDAGLLGNKTGAGFYLWMDNKPQEVNEQLLKYLKQ